ncbi:MAG: serine hydrolase [Nitrospirae bacterium]|nr:serine hydrolase [Nitrospirota bacterium]
MLFFFLGISMGRLWGTNEPFFGINYEERFAPASLLKVPTMMALFKEAESNPWILTKKVLYNGSFDTAEQNVAPSFMLEKGNQYTIDELAFRMIAYSDNKAQSLLLENLENKFFDKAYMDLGLLPPGQDTPDNFMTVKEYATFFRMLYNASYLNRAYSEKALDYLSKSEFRDGLIAGVPQGITVAHKFGERNFWNDAEGRQIHDCGIVYYPGHPYLLCVMSKGRYFQQLNDSVREISELAYTEVDRQYGRASGDYLAR